MSQTASAEVHAEAHDHAHGHATPTPPGFVPHHVAHHFKTWEQEFQSGKLGFWLFLATEILLFGGLFAAYIYYHGIYPETFAVCGSLLSWKLGALNTCVLLLSSWTMAMAVRAAQLSQRKACFNWLMITVACGAVFMVVKYFEYSAKIEHGTLPTAWFHPHGEEAALLATVPHPSMFFSIYFTMTGIHGLHVLIGMIVISWYAVGVAKGRYHSGHYLPIDLVGLYWHIVDIIWIFLFPLLYLVP
ncbi:MAG TPA: cytochrome c oxidase subunit 3 family protein [Planctomycetota bacterium]|nr:cytochrome c oxidase subunit 3 family protein [Planctomycetota bacterium]